MITEEINALDTINLEQVAKRVDPHNIDANQLRNETIASTASKIAVVPQLREILTQKMRNFASNINASYRGVVLDGRDVGTVILPDADVKIYLTADELVRAHRRSKELNSQKLEKIMVDIKARDARDSNRQVAPLQIADDAIVIDTTFLSISEVCQKVAKIVENALAVFKSVEHRHLNI